MLLPCAHSPAPLPKTVPEKVLPPVFGTMFSIGPPISASPNEPEIEICISLCVGGVVRVSRYTAAVKAAPTLKPSTITRPRCRARHVR